MVFAFRNFITTLFLLGFLFFPTQSLAVDSTVQAPSSFGEINLLISEPQPRITIPGLNFSDPESIEKTEDNGNTYLIIPFLGEYLAAIYKYAIITAGILAVIMLLISGLQWMMPGNIVTDIITKVGGEKQEEQKNKARKRIVGAVTGLILAVTSYTILYTINPELTQFRNLKVQYIEKKPIPEIIGDVSSDLTPQDYAEPPTATVPVITQTEGPTVPPSQTGPVIGQPVPIFKQYLEPWKSQNFGACGTIKSSGCGPTSLSMVLKYYGVNTDPTKMAKEWSERGYRRCPTPAPTDSSCGSCANVGHNGMFADPGFLNAYNMKSTFLGKSKDKILKALREGKPVIASMSTSIFTQGSHFIVLTGVNADGSALSVNDPNKSVYCSDGTAKCSSNLQTIRPTAVPVDMVFPFIKASTLIEPR